MPYSCGENKHRAIVLAIAAAHDTKDAAVAEAKKLFEDIVQKDFDGHVKEACPRGKCPEAHIFGSVDPNPPKIDAHQDRQGKWVCGISSNLIIDVYCLPKSETGPVTFPPTIEWEE
ncbi:hypothetical protein EPO33_04945 [Patescibacteria group bacterium]|nr:MAG: hypothetical protein EPO33_04945 [Patescibacteria group bacterium]